MLSSTLCVMLPIHLQRLKLLRRTVEEMHLQENTLYDLDLWVNITQNNAQCPMHLCKFEATSLKCLGGYVFGRKCIR